MMAGISMMVLIAGIIGTEDRQSSLLWCLAESKMTNDIHVLVWDTNDVYAVLCHGIEN